MFTISTLKSSVFFLFLWGAAYATQVFGNTNVPFIYVLGGLPFGLFCGICESVARRSFPPDLTNSSSDYPRRRSAFMNTWFGKLAHAFDLGAMFACLGVTFLDSFSAGSVLYASFGMARHAGVLCVFIFRYLLSTKRLA